MFISQCSFLLIVHHCSGVAGLRIWVGAVQVPVPMSAAPIDTVAPVLADAIFVKLPG
jgi:hypothetical protein